MFDKRFDFYKLVDKVPVKCTIEEYSGNERIICRDSFDDVTVSTVFLPFDHSFDDDSEPILFETMVFEGPHDGYIQRYHTYDEAVEGHKEVCYFINKVSIDRSNKLDDLGI